jgi:hypothetical protein
MKMPVRALSRRGLRALAVLAAAGAAVAPDAGADVLPDAFPTRQAVAAHAEFLLQAPPPPDGAGTICMIDTGVTPLPDTASQIVERIAIDGGTPDDVYHQPEDPLSGHGSFVASTIASQVDGFGSAGIWPQAKIISVRVFRSAGVGATTVAYRNAMAECMKPYRNVRTITLSLSAADADAEARARVTDRIDEATRSRGISVVASVGNDGAASVNFPARVSSAFAVGATDDAGAFCGFSNRGVGLDIAALGCSVELSAFSGAVVRTLGTSYSTPVVAAVLHALRSYRADLSPAEAEAILLNAARRSEAGAVLDASAAFRSAGLEALVESYQRPESSIASPNAVSPIAEVPRAADTITTRRVPPPILVKARFRGGRLSVWVRPAGRLPVVFRVGARKYVRKNGVLNVAARRRDKILAWHEDEWGVRSSVLRVRQKR